MYETALLLISVGRVFLTYNMRTHSAAGFPTVFVLRHKKLSTGFILALIIVTILYIMIFSNKRVYKASC